MSGVIDLHEVIQVHVGVSLCGGKTRMSKHFLNGAQVCAGVKQMRCEGVPQTVWTYLLPQPALSQFGE
jgi:hypothetical protein